MISSEEIKTYAEEADIHPVNVQRDYVFGWLLKSIYSNEELRRLLVFKGGNCLRKVYYPDTRFSTDLDFSALDRVDPVALLRAINEACRAAERESGVRFLTDRTLFAPGVMIDRERKCLRGNLFFADFSGDVEELSISIQLDVTEYERFHLKPVTRPLLHPYSDAQYCSAEVICAPPEELVAAKLKCLIQRRHSQDLFDLVYATFINRSIDLDQGIVLRTFLSKTIFSASPGAAKKILLGIPLRAFGAIWDHAITCPRKSRFSFDSAADAFRKIVEHIFEGTTESWGDEGLFFSAKSRNLILEAGAERRLLRMSYDGVERLVEPYALSYKQAVGRPAREYFYAYDTTGGRTSPPGIKSFIQPGVQSIALSEHPFEPRFEIELAKAGEQTRRGYFGKGFSQGQRIAGTSNRRFTSARSAPAFKVQCPYCQKTFSRSTASTALNEHKTPDGYRCGGRTGYRVF